MSVLRIQMVVLISAQILLEVISVLVALATAWQVMASSVLVSNFRS